MGLRIGALAGIGGWAAPGLFAIAARLASQPASQPADATFNVADWQGRAPPPFDPPDADASTQCPRASLALLCGVVMADAIQVAASSGSGWTTALREPAIVGMGTVMSVAQTHDRHTL